MDFIIDYLERYEVGLLEYEEIVRSIHGYLTQGVMNQVEGTLIEGPAVTIRFIVSGLGHEYVCGTGGYLVLDHDKFAPHTVAIYLSNHTLLFFFLLAAFSRTRGTARALLEGPTRRLDVIWTKGTIYIHMYIPYGHFLAER